jgi:hypothetical protein
VDNGAAEWVHMVVVGNHSQIEVEGSLDTVGCSHFVVLEIMGLRLRSSTNL